MPAVVDDEPLNYSNLDKDLGGEGSDVHSPTKQTDSKD